MPALVLYSTNTSLAFQIAERFYRQVHYVWCTPHYDARSVAPNVNPPPPTSAPGDVYHDLLQEVNAGDQHSAKIKQNRAGILKGAAAKHKDGEITKSEFDEIAAIVKRARQSTSSLFYM